MSFNMYYQKEHEQRIRRPFNLIKWLPLDSFHLNLLPLLPTVVPIKKERENLSNHNITNFKGFSTIANPTSFSAQYIQFEPPPKK